MPGLLSKLLPRDPTFFEMFLRQSENVQEAAQAMVDLLEHYDNPAAGADRVERFEHAGDTIAHDIITRLNQTFITPFDREDIHELSTRIDDVVDLLDAAATRLVTYHVTTIRPGVADLARVVMKASKEIVEAIRVLEHQDHILVHCIEINRLENEADRVSRKLIADLFDQETYPLQIIKWKEIIELLEFAADKSEDVANVIETVTLKNA